MTKMFDSETGYDPGRECSCCGELIDVNDCEFWIETAFDNIYFCSDDCAYEYVSENLGSYIGRIVEGL